MSYQILVVDDENEIADLVEVYLNNENFLVLKAGNVEQAKKLIEEQKIDLALLDVMLPDGDGFSLCKYIRRHYRYPVIMLTAKDSGTDKINGLTLGADDYITKPFLPLELVARVKAQLRRYTRYNTGVQEEDNVLTVSGIVLNKETHECTLNEKTLVLTPTEFSILWQLCKNKGKVMSSEQLFREVWGEKYYTSSNNTIMVHIRHLREKMNDSGEHPKYIKTVWGVGYKIET